MIYRIRTFQFLLIFIMIFGCKNIQNESLENIKEGSQLKKRVHIRHFDNNNPKSYDYELYVNSKNDTLVNQIRVFNKSILDTLQSHFYEVEINEVSGQKYKGKIKLYSIFDTTSTKFEHYRSMELTLLQATGDSTYLKKYETKGNNEIEFDFIPYKDSVLTGHITEVLSIHDYPEDKEKMSLYINSTFIDNNIYTINPFVESVERANNWIRDNK